MKKRYSVTIQQNHYKILMESLILNTNGKEHIAFLLCGRSHIDCDPWDKNPEERLLSRKVIILPKNKIVESSDKIVVWKTNFLLKILKEIEEQNLNLIIVHNHPKDNTKFSMIDDKYEPELFKMIFNRNGGEYKHGSMVITPDGHTIGRIWNSKQKFHKLDVIRIIGDRFKFYYPDKDCGIPIEIFNRQALAFGDALNEIFSNLRVGIIGCGGTGSAIAMLLSRLGIGKILLIDDDYVDKSNLNRLHFSSFEDAELKKAKVDTISSAIKIMGLGTKVETIKGWVESEDSWDALKACDIIFGCTDDHSGRTLINRIAYFYLIPVIDMGLIIKVNDSDPPKISVLDGRVTILFPQNPCLLCRKIIDINLAFEETFKRNDPEGFSEQKKEAYVIGEGNPSPAVVTFTTEVATMAVNELIHRLQGFRGENGSPPERRRLFLTCEDRRTGARIRKECDICGGDKYWGRGDTEPFLDRI